MVDAVEVARHLLAEKPARERMIAIAAQLRRPAVFDSDHEPAGIRTIMRTDDAYRLRGHWLPPRSDRTTSPSPVATGVSPVAEPGLTAFLGAHASTGCGDRRDAHRHGLNGAGLTIPVERPR